MFSLLIALMFLKFNNIHLRLWRDQKSKALEFYNLLLHKFWHEIKEIIGKVRTDVINSKSNPNFRDIRWNVVENMILHEIFHVVSRFPCYISCYITENPSFSCGTVYKWLPPPQYLGNVCSIVLPNREMR